MFDELSRRAVLMAAGATAATSGSRKAFVLVPGAWHGAWAWRRVEPLLRAQGHDVFAVTLTGLAERAHLLSAATRLATHVRDVVELIACEDLRDVVLVGHSYAGVVVAAAAADAKVTARLRALVYLDAFVPQSGQSMLGLMNPKYSNSWREKAKATSNGLTVPPMLDAKSMGIAPSEAAQVDAKLTVHPMATLEDPATFDDHACDAVPKHYVRCGAYSGFKPWAEKAERWGWPVTTVDAGHDAMWSAPQAVADALLAVR